MTGTRPHDPELERIRTLFLQMCVRAESMVQQAVRAVVHRDPHMARAVVAADDTIDELQRELDRLAAAYLAQHRPGGEGLRLISTLLKMVSDLERIGDLAADVAQRGLDLGTGPGLEPDETLKVLGARVVEMLRLVSDGFVSGDPDVHLALRSRDAEAQSLHRAGFQAGLLVMAEHPDQAARALGYTSISRSLERIAALTVGIAEMVALLGRGEG
jgi:phosphate transport system protein